MTKYKTVLVMRHAKSSWAESGMPDHDRPLNKRGERDATQMANFLNEQGIEIDCVAASDANRAQKTANALIQTTENLSTKQLDLRDDFYLAAPRVYLNYLQTLKDDLVSTVILIGHNPGLESLVQHLSGDWETMPTAAIACFEMSASSWSDCSASDFRLDHMWRPKDVLKHYQ